MTTTSATRRLWAELVGHLNPAPEPPKRGSLCSILGSHDAHDGRCRDCGRVLSDADPVCRAEVHPPIGGRR